MGEKRGRSPAVNGVRFRTFVNSIKIADDRYFYGRKPLPLYFFSISGDPCKCWKPRFQCLFELCTSQSPLYVVIKPAWKQEKTKRNKHIPEWAVTWRVGDREWIDRHSSATVGQLENEFEAKSANANVPFRDPRSKLRAPFVGQLES